MKLCTVVVFSLLFCVTVQAQDSLNVRRLAQFSWEISGWALDVAVADTVALVGNPGIPGLGLFDVSNAANPVQTASYPTGSYIGGIDLSGQYAYLANGYSGGLMIVDISDPYAPSWVGFVDTPGSAYDVCVAAGYAYIADDVGGLRVINVSNPAAPQEVGSIATAGMARGVSVAGNHAYVSDGLSGLWIFDISDPAVPVQVGFYGDSGSASEVAIAGDFA